MCNDSTRNELVSVILTWHFFRRNAIQFSKYHSVVESTCLVEGHLHFDKSLLFCFMEEFNIDSIDILTFCQNEINSTKLKQMTKDEKSNP